MAFASQSLRNQGFIRTVHFLKQIEKAMSQSLRNQGFIRTEAQIHHEQESSGLNPFEIRVSFEPMTVGEYWIAEESQSLRNQGFMRTKKHW